MFKKLLVLLLTFSTILTLPSSRYYAYAASEPTITINSSSGTLGEEVSLNVNVSNNPGIICLQLSVSYDKNYIELISATDNGLLGKDNAVFTDKVSKEPYILSWNDSLSTTNYTNDGTLATLRFKVKSAPKSGSASVSVSVDEAFDADLNDLHFRTVNGKINVKTSSSTTTTTATHQSTTSTTQSTTTSSTTRSTTTSTTRPTTSHTSTPVVAKFTRLSGNDRISTAIAISKTGWKSSNAVVLAYGFGYADALAGVPLAHSVNAPILLTQGKQLEPSVLAEIQRLKANKIYILGGASAISMSIESSLKAKGITVVRLSGSDRYETAIAIAKELAKQTDNKFTEIFVASASNFPDALAVSSVAALKGDPILYMPKTGEVGNATKEYIKSTSCKKVTILGGESAISASGAKSLKNAGFTVTRVSGSDRYETALAIYKKYSSTFAKGSVCVATGTNFPDALAGAAYAAKLKAPVILVGSSVNSKMIDFAHSCKAKETFVFGGKNAVSDSIGNSIAS